MNTECPNCQRLKAELEKAQAKIAALEAERRRGRRQAAPFSRDEPKPDPKTLGRRPGQGRFTCREAPSEEQIQETVQVPLEACPECGGPLLELATHEQVQVDLPKVKPIVVRFPTESGYGKRGRKRVRSRHPEQVSEATGAAGVSIGPRSKALAADLKHRLGIPYRKIADLFQTAFGLEVTAGGLCQADEGLAEKAEPVYQELAEAIRRSAAVYADETGGRVGVLSAAVGLHRELSQLEREKRRGAVRFSRKLAQVLREALALRDEQRVLEVAPFRARVGQLEAKLDALLAEERGFTDADNLIAKRLRKQRRHLLRFLQVEGVEATHNRAERALRPAVIREYTPCLIAQFARKFGNLGGKFPPNSPEFALNPLTNALSMCYNISVVGATRSAKRAGAIRRREGPDPVRFWRASCRP